MQYSVLSVDTQCLYSDKNWNFPEATNTLLHRCQQLPKFVRSVHTNLTINIITENFVVQHSVRQVFFGCTACICTFQQEDKQRDYSSLNCFACQLAGSTSAFPIPTTVD